jgi:hypothetical protein
MNRAAFDELPGKRVLVGVTRVAPDGSATSHRQFVGVVQRVHEGSIVLRRTDGGGDLAIPADGATLKRAVPGSYRLRRTGEVVVDPDFLCSLRVPEDSDAAPGDASRVA